MFQTAREQCTRGCAAGPAYLGNGTCPKLFVGQRHLIKPPVKRVNVFVRFQAIIRSICTNLRAFKVSESYTRQHYGTVDQTIRIKEHHGTVLNIFAAAISTCLPDLPYVSLYTCVKYDFPTQCHFLTPSVKMFYWSTYNNFVYTYLIDTCRVSNPIYFIVFFCSKRALSFENFYYFYGELLVRRFD